MTTMPRFVLIALLLAVTAVPMTGCGCGDDDDSTDSGGTPDGDTEAVPDDDTSDDDGDDDVDDDVTDDDLDDDADDDTDPPLPDPTFGWILMDTDRDHVSWVLQQAAAFGVDNVQLSHDLIMDIDEITEDEDKAILLQDIAQEAHGLGLKVWVWAHEFARETYLICFDPDGDVWERRRKAYRDGLARIPEIDGVVLMFGSSDAEPWYVPCFCQWCLEQEPIGNPILDLIHSNPVQRLQQIYDVVGGVVMGEFGKELRVRTFMHMPIELDWLRDSLKTYENPDLMVMSKDVPQDWQPYYPDNPLIGDVGHRHQIIEMDLGNEYWGLSNILNGQVDYIYRRSRYERDAGARGYGARVERGDQHAFGNPNEINIYAASRLIPDETDVPDEVYRDWFDARYGIAGDTASAVVLKRVFRTSHDAIRKMYYTLGMWTLEKGSDVTGSARYPEQLWSRNTTPYDGDWQAIFTSLAFPGEQTLRDLWQESTEAIEIAQDNLDLLDSIEGSFSTADDFDELREMLERHRDATIVWRSMKDAMFRYMFWRAGHPDQADFVEGDAEELLDLADDMEARWGSSVTPGDPDRIRDFVADLRQGFPDQVDEAAYEQPVLFDIEAEDLGGGQYHVTWSSSAPMTSFIEWTEKLPLYPNTSGEDDSNQTLHEATFTVSDASKPHAFRVAGHDGATLYRSGDFWVGLDP
ncbi:MAG: hypothetical protein M5R36_05300 [Deltaproteobacteria bacterium]|nr:hypothetical protein [Deltaproteobacteria bacterium]